MDEIKIEVLEKVRIFDEREDGTIFLEVAPEGLYIYNKILKKIYGGTYFKNSDGNWYWLSLRYANTRKAIYQSLLDEVYEAKLKEEVDD